MHIRKIIIILLTILGLVVLLGGVSTVHVAQEVGVEDADTKNASQPLYPGRLQSVPLLTTAEGDMLWCRTYGGSDWDEAHAGIQTTDGGFAFAGQTKSYGAGEYDAWLVKTDAHGNVEWHRTYGGSFDDSVDSVIQTVDGGFALAGWTSSFGAGEGDFWLVKTDVRGNMEWQQTYGGSFDDSVDSVIQTVDGGFALAGDTNSPGAGEYDYYLVKTDSRGVLQWNQTYGGFAEDCVSTVIETQDGGYALAGYTGSFGEDYQDAWLVKTDVRGNMEWDRIYHGGSDNNFVSSGIQTTDGGYALAGFTGSFGFGGGEWDAWLVRTNAHGEMEWQQTYGGDGREEAQAMIETQDGGYALAGSYGTGEADFWLVKTDVHGTMEWQQTYGGADWDVANAIIQTLDGGFALVGYTDSYGAGDKDFWVVKTISPYAPIVTVVSPNGGEVWQDMQTITWTAINFQGDPLTYKVYYSSNGGQIWSQLATGLTESSYLWDTTTIVNGTTFLIRVEATDGWYTGVDVSDAPFEITNELMNSAPTVRVLRPNGGERVRGMYEIQWSANDPDDDPLTFTLSYSPNEGQTWTQIAREVTEPSYVWDTSGVQVGTTYLIKVEASDGVLRTGDRSDAPFTVEREASTEARSDAFFVPSFRVVEALGALLILLGLGKRQRRRNKFLEGQ